jgi:hypothetical protein
MAIIATSPEISRGPRSWNIASCALYSKDLKVGIKNKTFTINKIIGGIRKERNFITVKLPEQKVRSVVLCHAPDTFMRFRIFE